MQKENEEKLVSLTEQGDFGLGIQEITDEKEKKQIMENMNMKKNK